MIKDEQELLERTKKYCMCGSGVVLSWVKAYIILYCLEHDIHCDTSDWDYMIGYLWNGLKDILEEDINKEDFDLYLGSDLS